ncbi:MAG TPA: hypothetical protein VG796_03175 [Verrucomicrobiales bacterium]|nr:hypothetical protein [Verrucomicrobiales bacterium]
MNPESASLLNDLTRSGSGSGDYLIHALHARRRRVMQCRIAAVCVLTMTALAMLAARLAPTAEKPAPVAVTPPVKSFKISGNELLDSFPEDQPVALVTWPDGRQQLLAITPVPNRAVVARR